MLEADYRIVVSITFAPPPNISREDATKALAQNGISIAAGLTPWIRQLDANVVDIGPKPKLV